MSVEEKPKEGIEEAGKAFDWVEEEFEDFKDVYVKTDYPEPHRKFRVIYESFSLSMEEIDDAVDSRELSTSRAIRVIMLTASTGYCP